MNRQGQMFFLILKPEQTNSTGRANDLDGEAKSDR
jgi:hypothetical protein